MTGSLIPLQGTHVWLACRFVLPEWVFGSKYRSSPDRWDCFWLAVQGLQLAMNMETHPNHLCTACAAAKGQGQHRKSHQFRFSLKETSVSMVGSKEFNFLFFRRYTLMGWAFFEKFLMNLLYTLHALKNDLICVLSAMMTAVSIAFQILEKAGSWTWMSIWPS